MDNLFKAIKIFKTLNEKGAKLDEVSVLIIEKVLEEMELTERTRIINHIAKGKEILEGGD